jgi:outer membrane protein assembly factor BamB
LTAFALVCLGLFGPASSRVRGETDVPCWPRFHGPKGGSHSSEAGLLKTWPPEGTKLLWTAAKLTVADGKVSVKKAWESKDLDNHHGGVILLDGYLYGSSHRLNREKWICLDWKTGEMKYAVKGVGKGSLAYADGMLYTLSSRHVMGLVKATPDGHEVISKFKLHPQGKTTSRSHPVICGGRLYIRHNEYLYAYDVKAAP